LNKKRRLKTARNEEREEPGKGGSPGVVAFSKSEGRVSLRAASNAMRPDAHFFYLVKQRIQ
jgi:hypothetical protein